METKLGPRESVSAGIRRCASAEVERAAAALAGRLEPAVDRVHEARRTLKRARAVLRLALLPEAGDAVSRRGRPSPPPLRRELDALRDVARELADIRDAAVAVTTARGLADGSRGSDRAPDAPRHRGDRDRRVHPATLRALVRRLEARSDAVADPAAEASLLARLAGELSATAARLPRAVPAGLEAAVLLDGLARTYRRGRKAMERATGPDGTPADHHEWRKRAKDLRHQLELLAHARGSVEETVEALHRLGDVLGEAHDLAVLVETLQAEPALVRRLTRPDRIVDAAERRGRALEAEAAGMGERLWDEDAIGFAERWERWWVEWRT